MTESSKRAPTLYAIVAMKLIRAAFYLAVALEIFTHVGADLRPRFDEAVTRLRLDPESRFLRRIGEDVDRITPLNERWAAAGLSLFGLLLILEGIGLAFRVRWIGVLVIGQSAVFVLAESYALIRDPSWTIAVILAVNVAIVAYLHRNRARLFSHA